MTDFAGRPIEGAVDAIAMPGFDRGIGLRFLFG